jgi:hypothetical protein
MLLSYWSINPFFHKLWSLLDPLLCNVILAANNNSSCCAVPAQRCHSGENIVCKPCCQPGGLRASLRTVRKTSQGGPQLGPRMILRGTSLDARLAHML